MKYVIKDQETDEPKLKLYLEDEGNGVICLKGEDVEGFDWRLLTIENGKIRTVRSVSSEDSGFEIDNNGEIEIYYCED